jgi:hypothetical protein
MLALMLEHETRSIDAYSEGLRAEYVSNRITLHDLIFDQDRLRREWESFGNHAGPSIVSEIAEPVLYSALAKDAPLPKPAGGAALTALSQRLISLKRIPDLDSRMARTTVDELARQTGKLNELYRGLLRATGAPYLERIRKSTERPRSLDDTDLHTRVTSGVASSAFTAFAQVMASSKARIRVAQGLIALRRWQLGHAAAVPPSLEAAAKAAGLPSGPVDPYDGRPIRFASVDGQPTVYSVGQDGRDDGGRIDNARTPDSGDVLLRLPKS